MNHFIYVFDCPYHGYEHQLLCYRAYDIINNLERWKKLETKEVPMDADDYQIIQDFLKKEMK